MNRVGSIQPGVYAAKARGLALCAITIGAAYVYYLAVDADDAIPAAAADAIVVPPVIKAHPINQPIKIIPDQALRDATKPVQPDRATVAREIQAALAKANCYDGPISGKWTEASQKAASAFLVAVNAELPVNEPDPALLALATTHPDAACVLETPRYAGALAAQEHHIRAEQRSMLDHAWAPAEMLVRPKADVQASQATAPEPVVISDATPIAEKAGQVSASLVAVEDPSSAERSITPVSADPGQSALHFEGGNAVSEAVPDPAVQGPAPLQVHKIAKHKAKAAKRRASRHDDSTFGMSFDSIQRSLSSWFE